MEFSAPSGRGGLISVRDEGDRTVVDVYRCDDGVEVRGGPKESSAEKARKTTVADFWNNLLAFLEAGVAHYRESAPTAAAHLEDVYGRLLDTPAAVSWWEITRLMILRDLDTLAWEQPNHAANRVYKIRHELGMDVTGHAGF